ncbi:MAG: DNA polymerase III subunit delta' C-terminal domain-containing protein [Christensenella sp.]|nr:DNA polymerase III subunit delta' C-terminal domain-containing protein [Christensenella sp.]
MQERLVEAIISGRAPHAILISGPEGSGRRELARRCAALYCLGEERPERLNGCPNYYEIGEGTVKVDDIRTLLSSAAMQGFNGGKRAFVFVNAQNMSAQIQNTLLKTLEEPHSDTMLILTGNEFGLLPTIRSRCLIERIGASGVEMTARELVKDGMDESEARFFAGLADGIVNRARGYATEQARAFRKGALSVLERAVFEYAPFSEAAELVTTAGAETDAEETADEEPKVKGMKKKKRGDAKLAISLLTIFISVFRDAQDAALGYEKLVNSDCETLVRRIAAVFTTARIQGIIEMLASAQQKLNAGASVTLSLDHVLAKLYARG